MSSARQPHIMSAASNLMGICFILITGLKITHLSDTTFADEISLFSAANFLSACVLSHLAIRGGKNTDRYETLADYLFLLGMFSLFIAIAAFSSGLF